MSEAEKENVIDYSPTDPASSKPWRIGVVVALVLTWVALGVGLYWAGTRSSTSISTGDDSKLKAIHKELEAMQSAYVTLAEWRDLQSRLERLPATRVPEGFLTQEDIAPLVARLKTMEAKQLEALQSRDIVAPLAMAVLQLRERVIQGLPYDEELTLAHNLSQGDLAMQTRLQQLSGLLQGGVTTVEALRADFPALVRTLIQLDRTAQAEGIWEKALAAVGKAVTIRQTGEMAGDSTEAILARAETYLARGNFTQALAEMHTLNDRVARQAKSWVDAAEKLQEIQSIFRWMYLHILTGKPQISPAEKSMPVPPELPSETDDEVW